MVTSLCRSRLFRLGQLELILVLVLVLKIKHALCADLPTDTRNFNLFLCSFELFQSAHVVTSNVWERVLQECGINNPGLMWYCSRSPPYWLVSSIKVLWNRIPAWKHHRFNHATNTITWEFVHHSPWTESIDMEPVT
jgi:hypothetical protein